MYHKKRNFILFLSLIIFVVVCIDFNTGFAKWLPSVHLSVEEKYDSNINLEPEGYHRPGTTKSDFITKVSPGIGITYKTERHDSSLEYNLNYNWYMNNSYRNYLGHDLNLNHESLVTQHLKWFLQDNLSISENVESTNYNYISVNYGRRKNLNNSFQSGFEYQFGKRDNVRVYYNDRRIIYLNTGRSETNFTSDDSVTYGPGIDVSYWINIRNGFKASYQWERIDYDYTPSRKRDHADLGYIYRLSPQTSFIVDFAFDYFDAKSGIFRESGKHEGYDYKIYQLTAGFDKVFSPKWRLKLYGGFYYRPSFEFKAFEFKDIYESSSDKGFAGGFIVSFSEEKWNCSIEGDTGTRISYGDYNNRGFTLYRQISATLGYKFNDRLASNIRISYNYEDSPDTLTGIIHGRNRRETYRASTGLSYVILPWLNFYAEYAYRQESSTNISKKYNFSGYKDHTALIKLTAKYDWFK